MVVLSCKSFNPLNRVQEDGQGGIACGSAASITEPGSFKVQTGEDRRCGAMCSCPQNYRRGNGDASIASLPYWLLIEISNYWLSVF